ncbi:hypothetical protein ACFPMF_22980 [Larkinella bovis]|uniref:Uncharacterized protein n=1 Tax=Larkinella bovis TaxID=683041 RepID=A0ABW0IHJ5_9BACT
MCTTTRRNQTPAKKEVIGILPNQATGGGQPAPLPPNAFLGKPERVPDIVFIRERKEDGFLDSAKDYYTLFGIPVQRVDSVVEIVTALSEATQPYQRIGIVSHAHPRGMIIPFFTGGVRGTNKEIFREFAKSDLAGLKLLSPFETPVNHLFNWESVMGQLTKLIRDTKADVLEPFGLKTSGVFEGDLREYVKFCFDIVYLRDPGRVRRNASSTSGISKTDRQTLEAFVGEILDQTRPLVVKAKNVTDTQVEAVRTLITGITYNRLTSNVNMPDVHPNLGLDTDNMNDFPTLKAAVKAVKDGVFRAQLTAARTHIKTATLIDVRGCRAGEDADYVEAIREFLGSGEQKPTVTAPRWFQAYPKIAFRNPTNQSQVKTTLDHASQWGYTPTQRKAAFTTWAELIRVKPLHLDFWLKLLKGKATALATLAWRSQIPALFIATPGLTALNSQNFNQVIGSLKDFFAVPTAAVPKASVLTALQPITSNLPTWGPKLLTLVAAGASATQRTTLFQQLQQINDALSQSFVPTTSPHAPDPPTVAELQGYQTALLTFLEDTKLTPIKTFLTAAATSLETGDGLHYYMLFAGLPVFVHGTPELTKNGLVVLDRHKGPALQAWYQCLWKDALPASGPYKTATIGTKAHRQVTGLVGEDRASYLSICPIPSYMNCIRKRPLPPDEDENLCG